MQSHLHLKRGMDRIESPKAPPSHTKEKITTFLGTAAGRIVAAAGLTATSNGDISEGKVRAAVRATENVVVVGIIGSCALDVVESDTADGDAVGWVTGGAAVEVVLLDVDTVVGDTRDSNVLVNDVADLYVLSVACLSGKRVRVLCHQLTLPVVSALLLMRQPFSLLTTWEFLKVTPATVLLLFPPTDPMLRP